MEMAHDKLQGETQMGVRRFGRVNWLGLYTLTEREIRRFLAVWTQTLLAPLVTAGLFLTIFTLAIGPSRGDVMGVPFVHFLAPGILTMTVIQNAFANTSSSIMISKVQGNIVDTLMPPLSPGELVIGYLSGGAVRGMIVAVAIWTVMAVFVSLPLAHPLFAIAFVLLGALFIGGLGILAGIVSQKFDHMAAITNFIITPLSFLSGTFYSVETLPQWFKTLTHMNPVFYLIDGVRYGIIGRSDSAPLLGLCVMGGVTAVVVFIDWQFFKRGTNLKS
ncbi:ABC transporter permease [Celeribacter neptunius]|uniref:Transport permease protein n=1 Tax=Celeribacter neptunius TaxID=588602 RepID=A0A1I3W6L5_9RHOB|nr:ABC transporter permease [Celeribacter neptunius]SFK03135.1 ABC-2 type transport system permease protein [Celeribacter neptunius]